MHETELKDQILTKELPEYNGITISHVSYNASENPIGIETSYEGNEKNFMVGSIS